MSHKHGRMTRQLVRAAVAAALGATLAAVDMTAVAAESNTEPQELEEVSVTGSRIVRRDYEANSPIITLDTKVFEEHTSQNVEAYLNELPNYNPASTPTTTEDDIQPTAVNSVGIATISLRGFGANRNLVLMDGKRPVPANSLGVVDVNAIPASMLERVEIITGGASAVYGADAVGGVTNFILRKNYTGLKFDTQYGFSDAGDGEEFRASILAGTDFSEGRGNITVALEHYDRQAAYERNYNFYTRSWRDPNQLSDDLFLYGGSRAQFAGYSLGGGVFNTPNKNVVKALLPGTPAGTGVQGLGPTGAFRIGPDGRIWSEFGDNLAKYEAIYGPNAYNDKYAKVYNFDNTITTQGVLIENLKYNDTEALLSAPQKRYSFFTSANYDITDDVNFFARANFAQSKTFTLLYPTVPIYGWEAQVPFNPATDSPLNPALDWTNPATATAYLADPNNAMYVNPNFIATGTADPDGTGPLLGAQHPVSPEVAILLMSRPVANGNWIAEQFPDVALGRRTTTNTNNFWQTEAGFNFNLPLKDWTGEFYWSHGETSSYNDSQGNLSLQRWRALLNQPDWGRNATVRANADYPTDPSRDAAAVNFGTTPVHCTSGFYDMYFAGDNPPSQDCLDAVAARLQERTSTAQDVVELNLQGGIVNLPAGELRGAVGGSWRDNKASFVPDILESNISFLDQVVGKYPVSYLDVSGWTKDIYGELLVPVVAGLPGLKKLELELGFRSSSYEHTDSTNTYKALANIQVNDALRFRGGYNRANRAPNLGELFLGLQETYVGPNGIFNDPCSIRSNASYGAGGAVPEDPSTLQTGEPQTHLAGGQTQEGAYSTYLICQAQMTPVGSAVYYANDFVEGAAGGGFANAWRYTIGNANLKSEKADTWSLGFVFSGSGLSSNPWIRGFTGAVDWWKVDIDDAIQPTSADYAGYQCYGVTTVTTLAEAQAYIDGPGKFACDNVDRDPSRGGTLAKVNSYDNQATIRTSGIDVSLNWAASLGDIGINLPGGVNFGLQGSFLRYYKTKQSPLNIDVPIEWKGSLGPDLLGTNPGAYSYRLIGNIGYRLNRLNVNLGFRYLPSVITAAEAYQRAVIANNERVVAGKDPEAIILSYTPSEAIKARDYLQFNLAGTYEVNDMLAVRAGIDNVFNNQPPWTGATTGVSAADAPHRCDGAVQGCQNPGGPSLARSGSGTTAKGFYSVGRRFFVGVSAKF